MQRQAAIDLMNSDDLYRAKCGRCQTSLERGCSMRSSGDDEAELLCFDCGYRVDVTEFRETGILRSSIASSAVARRDWETFRPHFDVECAAAPVFTAVWERYRSHERMNHPTLKQGVQIDLSTGAEYPRDWNNDGAAAGIVDGAWVLEVIDVMCGYRAITVWRKNDKSGMWMQGQVRPGDTEKGWYRSCFADQTFVDEALKALRQHIDPTAAWERAIDDVRDMLYRDYNIDHWFNTGANHGA
jgi:hypothetical protein